LKPLLFAAAALFALAAPAFSAPPQVCAGCVTANMQRLAGDELRGRACGTADENAAARFVAGRLAAYHVPGGAEDGGYLQRVEIHSPTYAAPPTLDVGGVRLVQGREMLAIRAPQALSAPLVLAAKGEAAPGGFALMDGPYDPQAAVAVLAGGAVGIIAEAPSTYLGAWDELAARPPHGTVIVGVEATSPPEEKAMIFVRPQAMAALRRAAGREARLTAARGAPAVRTTYNVLGVLHGTAPDADARTVLLSAHYDHVGVRGGVIYHGANDDASGTAAVLEFARILGARHPPRRTVRFALFGCEEEGGHGAKYFLAHPPIPLQDLAANLEFEMIGAPDPKDRKALMLTGWERSNLGPILREHGASIGPDPYPQENFFQRSDNYQLARKGVVAQTISAWPVPPTYHQATDDLAHLDLAFMIEVIQSLAGPVEWLADSDFRPEWNPGGRP
jgi:hypothetical protein